MELCTVFLGILGILLLELFRRWLKLTTYVSSLGVPVDNARPWFKQRFNIFKHDAKCLQKFGHVWAHVDGVTPVLMVAEPDLIKEIIVKKFDKFPNHMNFGVEEKHLDLVDARDEKWRAIRKSLSPTFTSGKLKGMMDHMGKVADNMVQCLENKTKKTPDGAVNIKEVFQGLSLDTIANCAFGIETNSFADPGNDLFQRCLTAFSDLRISNHTENIIMQLCEYFPFLVNYLDLYGKENYSYLSKITKDIIDSRQEKRGGDFIDRLTEILEEVNKAGPSSVLSEEIVLAQGIIFFIAGFETTSNCLSTLSYNLAKNPEVQEKIWQEVKKVLEEFDGSIDYETINQMPYLEAAINENLRICPPVVRLDRQCAADCTVGPYNIKKDTLVIIPIYAMHHSPRFFPEPEKFKPERFLKGEGVSENLASQYAFLPFGGGPRLCIGMRFAVVEIKIAMAKLLANFKIVDTPVTKLEPLPGDPFMFSYPDIKVKLEKRTLL